MTMTCPLNTQKTVPCLGCGLISVHISSVSLCFTTMSSSSILSLTKKHINVIFAFPFVLSRIALMALATAVKKKWRQWWWWQASSSSRRDEKNVVLIKWTEPTAVAAAIKEVVHGLFYRRVLQLPMQLCQAAAASAFRFGPTPHHHSCLLLSLSFFLIHLD